jgi:enamidase
VVISGDRILRVTDDAVTASGARRIDARGMTVLPGLIDAHVHLTIRPTVTDTASLLTFIDRELPGVLRGFLQHGVTTVRSTGDYWPWIGQVRDRITSGELQGPRLRVAGPVVTLKDAHPATTVCQGNPFCRAHVVAEVTNAEEARATIDRLAREGIDYVKLVSDSVLRPLPLPDDVLDAIIAQGHRHGLDVVAHMAASAVMQRAARQARQGLDGFVHPTFGPLPDQGTRELSGVLVQQGTPVTTTISALLLYSGMPVDQAFQAGTNVRRIAERSARALATMVTEGVQLVVGTDWCGCVPTVAHQALQPGSVTLTEMEMLAWGGLTPEAILAGATRNAARALGLDQVGTLEAGKLADVLVVAGNPLQDIRQLRAVRAVVKGGVLVSER